MENKNHPGSWLGSLVSGKGFYIALLLSAAVIATSLWLMFAEKEAMEETSAESNMASVVLPEQMPVTQQAKSEPEAKAPEVEQELARPLPTASSEMQTVFNEEEEDLPLYFIWPVSGQLERGHSMDALLYDRTMADWRTHDGWDIAAPLGAQVLSAADGTVISVTSDDLYGTMVEIDHGNGLVSCYANLAATPTVTVGESVQVGDVIGAVGDTALAEVSEQYHLHFTMRLNGESADPANWLPER